MKGRGLRDARSLGRPLVASRFVSGQWPQTEQPVVQSAANARGHRAAGCGLRAAGTTFLSYCTRSIIGKYKNVPWRDYRYPGIVERRREV